MKSNFRKISLISLATIILTVALVYFYFGGLSGILGPNFGNSHFESIEARAQKALGYAKRNGMNQDYCLLVDYSIPSGTPRMFVWSFEKNKIVYRAHVMHGPGKGSTAEMPVFSNEPGSSCSCLGKFEVTQQHGQRNKRGFRVKGKDLSNSMAYSRGIMIHGAKWVDANKWRKFIPLNSKCCLGCLTVSTKDMNYLYKLIEGQKSNLLLWTYSETA